MFNAVKQKIWESKVSDNLQRMNIYNPQNRYFVKEYGQKYFRAGVSEPDSAKYIYLDAAMSDENIYDTSIFLPSAGRMAREHLDKYLSGDSLPFTGTDHNIDLMFWFVVTKVYLYEERHAKELGDVPKTMPFQEAVKRVEEIREQHVLNRN